MPTKEEQQKYNAEAASLEGLEGQELFEAAARLSPQGFKAWQNLPSVSMSLAARVSSEIKGIQLRLKQEQIFGSTGSAEALMAGGALAAVAAAEFDAIIKGNEVTFAAPIDPSLIQQNLQLSESSWTLRKDGNRGGARLTVQSEQGETCEVIIKQGNKETTIQIPGINIEQALNHAAGAGNALLDILTQTKNADSLVSSLFAHGDDILDHARGLVGMVAFPKRVAGIVMGAARNVVHEYEAKRAQDGGRAIQLQKEITAARACMACGTMRKAEDPSCSSCGCTFEGPYLSDSQLERKNQELQALKS